MPAIHHRKQDFFLVPIIILSTPAAIALLSFPIGAAVKGDPTPRSL